MDVDGVLTDGTVFLGNGNTELKSFNVRDGMAISIAHKSGIKIGFLTSRKSEAVEKRGEELKIEYLCQGVRDKLSKVKEISRSEGVSLGQICYIGDDIIDIPVLKKVGFAATVADAPEEVKAHVNYISVNKGGHEAVRDIIQHIMTRQNSWKETTRIMVKEWEDGQTNS
jgi:3-deoxy-D-manno-octulosonate 8-phosphate phosphatase (KDO 8-P phosphatase)